MTPQALEQCAPLLITWGGRVGPDDEACWTPIADLGGRVLTQTGTGTVIEVVTSQTTHRITSPKTLLSRPAQEWGQLLARNEQWQRFEHAWRRAMAASPSYIRVDSLASRLIDEHCTDLDNRECFRRLRQITVD